MLRRSAPGWKSRTGWKPLCFCITFPAPTVPCDCEILDATTLPMKLAPHDTCYRIYKGGAWLDLMGEF